MKKLLCFVAILLIATLLAGCIPGVHVPSKPTPPDTSTTTPGETTPPTEAPDDGKTDDPTVEIPDDGKTEEPPVEEPPVENPGDNTTEEPPVEEPPAEEPFEDYGMPVIDIYLSQVHVEEDGIYDTMEEVGAYIYLFGKLPQNYLTNKSTVTREHTAENKLSYTGGTFYNRENLLPVVKGRTFTECDIGYTGGGRNALRIVFSNDGLIFYTSTHYASFSILRIHNDVD